MASKSSSNSKKSYDWLNTGIIVIILAGAGFCVWQGWLAAQPVAPQVPVQATPTPSAQAGSVTLKLNQTHAREGATIQVNPAVIGRANPFTKP